MGLGIAFQPGVVPNFLKGKRQLFPLWPQRMTAFGGQKALGSWRRTVAGGGNMCRLRGLSG